MLLFLGSAAIIALCDTVTMLQTGTPEQVLAFSAASYNIGEGGPATLIIQRTGGNVETVTVQCSTAGDAAVADVDYRTIATTVTFAPGATSEVCLVPIVNDNTLENQETFRVWLSEPTAAVLGTLAIATVTIVDDDDPSLAGKAGPLLAWPTIPNKCV